MQSLSVIFLFSPSLYQQFITKQPKKAIKKNIKYKFLKMLALMCTCSPLQSGTTFLTGRRSIPAKVLMSTTLTVPSWPGNVAVTTPRGQVPLGKSPSAINTGSPMLMADWLVEPRTLLGARIGRYSRTHLLQKWSVSRTALRQLLRLYRSASVKSAGTWYPEEEPIRKWNGVRASGSSGSGEMCVRGREFTMASASARSVSKTSSDGLLSFRVTFNAVLTLFTKRSQAPPMNGADGGINFHSILWFVTKFVTSCPCNSRSCRLAPTKAVPLSEKI